MKEMISNMPVIPEKKISAPEEDNEVKPEKEPGFDMEVYVTDHSPDNIDTGNPENLKKLYEDVASDGVDRVRYDFHWGKLEKQPGGFDRELIERYKSAKNIQEEVGLKEPIIILSNPPKWAIALYKEGKKEEFYQAFRKYVEEVKGALEQAGGKKITTIQILNELNNKIYTPVSAEDIPMLCHITRDVFSDYNPDLKLMATVNANNLAKLAGTDAEEFLPEFRKIKGSFDRIAIDYYPGTWHFPMDELNYKNAEIFLQWPPTKGVFKELVKQIDYLKKMMEEVADWGVEYEIGETGMPSKFPWGGEKSQRYYYDAFFRALKHLLVDFRKRGIKLPSAIGLYEAIDEPPRSLAGKTMDKLTPHPEARFGMRKGNGQRKSILKSQGVTRSFIDGQKIPERSQLKADIDYLRAPMKRLK